MSSASGSSGAVTKPSSAGACQVCGKHAEKRYGGEGRYLVMCLDCWLADDDDDA